MCNRRRPLKQSSHALQRRETGEGDMPTDPLRITNGVISHTENEHLASYEGLRICNKGNFFHNENAKA